MSQKVRVVTWKMAPHRYLHEVITERGYFHIVTDSDCFSLRSFTLRNKVFTRRSTKETRGLRKVREERDEWLNEDEWAILCFSGCDNLELRKRVYGKELRKIGVSALIWSGGTVEYIKDDKGKNITGFHSVYLRGRNLKKRISNPLPYITNERGVVLVGETSRLHFFQVDEPSWIMFTKKIESWGL